MIRLKILSFTLAVLSMLMCAYVVHVKAMLDGERIVRVTLNENMELKERLIRLLELHQAKTTELFHIKVRLGEAYRSTLYNLVDDLGLDSRPNAATIMLRRFEGVGGPGG